MLEVREQLPIPSGLEVRPYQRRIAAKAIGLLMGTWASEKTRTRLPALDAIAIESPTGSGKTVVALTVAKWMQQHQGMRVGWVAMRRNLLTQVAKEERTWRFGVKMHLISMFDKKPPQVDLLVVDEAQHDAALSMANLYSHIQPRKILGLTATPYRTDRFKLCFQHVIRDAGIHALIQDGYLSRYHHFTIPAYTPQSVADTYLLDPQRWGQSLVFFHRQVQCIQCQRLLADQGVTCEVVTAHTDRQRQIDDFQSGRISVLINMLILSEGFDCPSIQTVFCRPSGRLCTTQMCGRVFRNHPQIDFKQIVQCERTRHPFPRTATPDEQCLWTAQGWRSLTPNRQTNAVAMQMRQMVSRTQTTMPKWLGRRNSRNPDNRSWRGSGD